MLGSKAKEFREFREKSSEIARTMQPLFTATPEGRKVKSQFQKTRLYEANKFVKSLGINVNDFKSILSKYQEESKSAIEKTRTVEGSLRLDVSPIPPDVVHPDLVSPWYDFHPPYLNGGCFGEAYAVHSGDAEHFSPYTYHYESNLTGEISCTTQNVIYNAGDYAHQYTVGSSMIWFYFQMPESGRLNILTQVQCLESSYSGFLNNWFGYSDATTMQTSRYFMTAGESIDGDEAYFQLLDYSRHTDDDVEWGDNMVTPGEYRVFNLVSHGSFSAGQWVPIKAGILDYQDATLDDMGFIGEIKNSWILHGFWVSAFNP